MNSRFRKGSLLIYFQSRSRWRGRWRERCRRTERMWVKINYTLRTDWRARTGRRTGSEWRTTDEDLR